jgi:hypothetical protein
MPASAGTGSRLPKVAVAVIYALARPNRDNAVARARWLGLGFV